MHLLACRAKRRQLRPHRRAVDAHRAHPGIMDRQSRCEQATKAVAPGAELMGRARPSVIEEVAQQGQGRFVEQQTALHSTQPLARALGQHCQHPARRQCAPHVEVGGAPAVQATDHDHGGAGGHGARAHDPAAQVSGSGRQQALGQVIAQRGVLGHCRVGAFVKRLLARTVGVAGQLGTLQQRRRRTPGVGSGSTSASAGAVMPPTDVAAGQRLAGLAPVGCEPLCCALVHHQGIAQRNPNSPPCGSRAPTCTVRRNAGDARRVRCPW